MLSRYALFNRPAGIGTIPRGLTYTVEPPPCFGGNHHALARHGILVTDRELTINELADFELFKIIDGGWAEDWLVDMVADELAKYHVDYLQMYQDDINEFYRCVRTAVRDAGRFSVCNNFPEKVKNWLASI